ncbi:MAG: methyltransferase domain-containing protein [Chitinophagaceae bacterium]|nr:MAG: methyltransferase domain-containing protein [Chitinophagaceae bacterium]
MKLINKIKRKLGLKVTYPSETSKVRHLVLHYCVGKGCDIGFGGDKIKPDAIGIDFANPYATTGHDEVDIACDVMKEPIPVEADTFDYVYTSHLIEDFEETAKGLTEFIRVLKSGGNLILVFPDQPKYEAHCRKTGQPLNTYHKHADMGRNFMLTELGRLPKTEYIILFESNCEIDYNVVLVLQIIKHG